MNYVALNSSLLAVLIVLQCLVLHDRAIAVRVAREAAQDAVTATREAAKAALNVNLVLARLEALYADIQNTGGKTLRATGRMEEAAGVVAGNLADDKTRAKVRMHADDYEPGSAADAYAALPNGD